MLNKVPKSYQFFQPVFRYSKITRQDIILTDACKKVCVPLNRQKIC